MRQQIDIADVELATKIRAKYLRALENEEFDLLPGPTFVRSFIRTYAEFLGLDAQLLVEEFRHAYEPAPTHDQLRNPISSRPIGDQPDRRFRPGRGIAMSLGFLALIGFLLVLGLTGDDDGGKPPSTTSSTPSARTTPAQAPTTTTPVRKKPVPTSVVLRVAPDEGTAVCVEDSSGDVVFNDTLEESRTFKGKRLNITIGRRNVQLTNNGKRIAVPEGADPISYAVTPTRAKELDGADGPTCL